MSARPDDKDYIDGPAKFTSDHFPRTISKVAGAKKAWKVESKLGQAFLNGKLADPWTKDAIKRDFDAYCRLCAGEHYSDLYEMAYSSGINILDPDKIAGSFGAGVPSQNARAMSKLHVIHKQLSRTDRLIIEHICGRNESIAAGVCLSAGDGYKDRTWVRFREAMDSLVEIIERIGR